MWLRSFYGGGCCSTNLLLLCMSSYCRICVVACLLKTRRWPIMKGWSTLATTNDSCSSLGRWHLGLRHRLVMMIIAVVWLGHSGCYTRGWYRLVGLHKVLLLYLDYVVLGSLRIILCFQFASLRRCLIKRLLLLRLNVCTSDDLASFQCFFLGIFDYQLRRIAAVKPINLCVVDHVVFLFRWAEHHATIIGCSLKERVRLYIKLSEPGMLLYFFKPESFFWISA